MARARALTRTQKTFRADRRAKAAAALSRLRKSNAALRSKYKASAKQAQMAQLGWTVTGGAVSGAAQGFFPDVMGIDTRLVAGGVLAAVCLMSKSDGLVRPACGLASGMLAAYLSDTVADMVGPADSSIPDLEAV